MDWARGLRRLAAAVLALGAALAVPALTARAQTEPVPSASHVVIVGISGLSWNDVSPSATQELWRLAQAGSVGSLVDYAQQPLACPADGWLTLNSAARAQGSRPCTALPAVIPQGAGARIPALRQVIRDNQPYHEAPDWGLLGTLARCTTAVGPGAALALASADGTVASYRPSVAGLSEPVLARCPLTVIDLGQLRESERAGAAAVDRALARIAAELPPGTRLLVIAPGAAAGASRPHLESVVVTGAGYARGLLGSPSTRWPGIVTLTDLTPTVAGWLGHPVPPGTVGARVTRVARGDLGAAVSALARRETAEQVWLAGHGWFFVAYAAAAAAAFALPALAWPGGQERARYRRAQCWRVAGVAAAAVPLGSYLANLADWAGLAHPAWWLYGLTAGWTLVAAAAALAGPWRRDPLGPLGALCAATAALLAVDVMTGSRLQQESPFGLSLLVSGRFYGIGNDALGVYCVSVLVAAGWAARLLRGRTPGPAVAAAAIGLLAVVASGWPGFGAKAGGTIALVPCLILLTAWLAGVRVGRRLALPVALSGLVLFLVFAAGSYFFPAAGVSDLAAFGGNLLHGRGGAVLSRKVSADVGSLTLSVFGWLVPVAALAAALALARPGALRLRTLAAAFTAVPLLAVLAWLAWLVLVTGWFADDSGVVVPAVALPFAVPLMIALASAVRLRDPADLGSVSPPEDGARYCGTAFAGPPSQADTRGLSE